MGWNRSSGICVLNSLLSVSNTFSNILNMTYLGILHSRAITIFFKLWGPSVVWVGIGLERS